MMTAMLDTDSLASLVNMQGFSALLDPEIVSALTQVGTLLVGAAQDNTWKAFQNPTGELASNITFQVLSPEEVAVTSSAPQSHRLEKGFYGPDSLGRVFPNYVAEPFLLPALDDNEDAIIALIEMATNNALGRI